MSVGRAASRALQAISSRSFSKNTDLQKCILFRRRDWRVCFRRTEDGDERMARTTVNRAPTERDYF